MNVKEKIQEVSLLLDELDDFKENISSSLQSYDYKLSDLYHYLEKDMKLNSKTCYRFCKEMKKILSERREYKYNLQIFQKFESNKGKIMNGKDNRSLLVSQLCKEDKIIRNSVYHNRLYKKEDFQEKIGG